LTFKLSLSILLTNLCSNISNTNAEIKWSEEDLLKDSVHFLNKGKDRKMGKTSSALDLDSIERFKMIRSRIV
jgi:hypothetical protein